MLLSLPPPASSRTDEGASVFSQASSTKLPLFLRSLLARLASFHTSHPTSSTTIHAFLTSQLAALQPILDAPRPAGRSNLVNSNLAGALALPAAFAAAAGGNQGLTESDKAFSKVAKETADGLKEELKCDSFCLFFFR